MRLAESDRQIYAAGLMGRRTVSKRARRPTRRAGWIRPGRYLPRLSCSSPETGHENPQAGHYPAWKKTGTQSKRWSRTNISGVYPPRRQHASVTGAINPRCAELYPRVPRPRPGPRWCCSSIPARPPSRLGAGRRSFDVHYRRGVQAESS